MVVLGAGLIVSAVAGVPPWGGDQPPVVRLFVIVFGLLLPGFELFLPRLRQRWPLAFPDRPRRWSRSALWGAFFVAAGTLALPDWVVAAATLSATGLIYLVEAWALRSVGAPR
jgi:hypothetical protein